MKVGDKVWIKSYRGNKTEVREEVISKIGRKYLEIQKYSIPVQFHIDGLREKSDYGIASRLYTSLQELKDEEEHDLLSRKIRDKFNGYSKLNIPLETLRKISDLLQLNDKEE